MIFNASEVFEIAEQIERNGQKFYRKAVEVVKDPEIKEFLASLAAMEDDHEILFNQMKKEIMELPENTFPDMDDQLTQYLQSFADGKIFESSESPENKIDKNSTISEVFDIAIDFERNSVIYFTLIKETVPPKLGREKIDILIKEEIKHIAVLNNRLNSLDSVKI
jgi:rubrerythrin